MVLWRFALGVVSSLSRNARPLDTAMPIDRVTIGAALSRLHMES